MNGIPDPLSLALILAALALVPFLVVITTSFVKISVVMLLIRNALGVQQIPPNMAIYGLSIILTLYIMAPVTQRIYEVARTEQVSITTTEGLVAFAEKGVEPFRGFLYRHSDPEIRGFFVNSARKLWPDDLAKDLDQNSLFVLAPAFTVTELTDAFQIGFLLYLPFVVIDLIVSNILLAMGMMMVSPMTISLPLKLLLFVMVDGWTRLIKGLVLTYAGG